MEMNELQKKEIKEITSRTEMRSAYHLADKKVHDRLQQDGKLGFYDVAQAQKENLKIGKYLHKRDELNIPKEQLYDLSLNAVRNENFLFVNMEKWTGDSKLMSDIKRGVSSYEALLRETLKGSRSEEGEPVDLNKNLADYAENAISFCDQILANCNTYLGRGRSIWIWRWSRYTAVQRLKERIEGEKKYLERVKDDRFAKKYGSIVKDDDTLLTILNSATIKGRLKAKQEKDNQIRNQKLKTDSEKVENDFQNKKKQIEEDTAAVLGTKVSGEDRKMQIAATTMSVMNGYSKEETAAFFTDINKDYEKCNEEEKKKKIQRMEAFFDTLTKFDLKQLEFKTLEDLFNPEKYEKCRMITIAGADCEDMITLYQQLLNGPEKKYLSMDKAAFDEVIAKRNTLMVVAPMLDNMVKVLQNPAAEKMNLDEMQKLSTDELMERQANAWEDENLEQLYKDLRNISFYLKDQETGETLFGAGMSIDILLQKERQKACRSIAEAKLEKELNSAKEKYQEGIDQLTFEKEQEVKASIEKNENSMKEKERKELEENAPKKAKEFRENQLKRDEEENQAQKKVYDEKMKELTDKVNSLLNKKETLTKEDKEALKKAQSEIALRVMNRQTDMKVYARNSVDMQIKKQVSFKVMQDLSEFYPMMEAIYGQKEARDKFKELVGKFAADKNGAMEQLADDLMKFEIEPKELLSYDQLSLNMEKYNQMSGMVEAYKRLRKNNPDGAGAKEGFNEKFEKLCAATDLFRVRKQILLDPSFSAEPPVTLKNYPGEKRESFVKAHFRRMLMVSEVLERNFCQAAGVELPKDTLSMMQDSSYAEADRKYALRLSKEARYGKVADEASQEVRNKLLSQMDSVKKELNELEESLKKQKKKGEKYEHMIQIREKIARLELLDKKMKKENEDDPSNRIADALRLIEQERFRIPQDFNITDFDHIPEKMVDENLPKEEKEEKIVEKLGVFYTEGPQGKDPNLMLAKKMGNLGLKEWYDNYKNNYLKKQGQAGEIRSHAKSNSSHIIQFNDNFDRMISHFYGSYHFGRTDAEMREQIEALTYAASMMGYDDDDDTIQYMDSMYKEMVLRMHAQMNDVIYRNLYGGVNKLMLMTPVDQAMSSNVYQKYDLLSVNTVTNVDMKANFGNYLSALNEYNTDDQEIIEPEVFEMGAGFSYVTSNMNILAQGRGKGSTLCLPKAIREEFSKYVNGRQKAGVDRKTAEFEFMEQHPELWDNKAAYSKEPDPEDSLQKQNIESNREILLSMYFSDNSIKRVLSNEYVEKLTPQQIDTYLKDLKKQNYQGFPPYDQVVKLGNEGFKDMNVSDMLVLFEEEKNKMKKQDAKK